MRGRLIASLSILSMLLPLGAAAQTNGAPPLTIELSPMYPRPYDVVSVTPSSNLIDLTNSKTSFYVNGALVGTGSGTESKDIRMKGAGVPVTVRVTASYQGKAYEVSILIRPADVALVAEPVSVSHPFYAGGNLIASQGNVRLVAVPDLRTSPGNRIAAQNLSYTWKIGDAVLQDSSGLGKSSVTVSAPIQYRSSTASVIVTNSDGSIAGEASVDLIPVTPLLRLYELDPLLGARYERAIPSSFSMNGNEDTFLAVPYFFGSFPKLAWTLNGQAAGANPSLTMRQSGNGAGTAAIDLSATLDAFSSASASIQVSFGQAKSTGFFGL